MSNTRTRNIRAGLQTARAIVLDQREAFKDPAYAGGPLGAFGEIFACTEILAAIDLAIERAGNA